MYTTYSIFTIYTIYTTYTIYTILASIVVVSSLYRHRSSSVAHCRSDNFAQRSGIAPLKSRLAARHDVDDRSQV